MVLGTWWRELWTAHGAWQSEMARGAGGRSTARSAAGSEAATARRSAAGGDRRPSRHSVVRVVDSARRLAERDGARRRGLKDMDSARRPVPRDGARRHAVRGPSFVAVFNKKTSPFLERLWCRRKQDSIGAVAAFGFLHDYS
eukprot:659393-Pleurochrysis_carterae.AAC.3